ncbi:MAG: 1-acyl-sn-glycerol-3-phosphate acyltransferase [Planctomycetes bacterium]|nr:1-acyl-sn-glycerol-3-phosphate acyltransferase [Planctomycetota bacterium]
MTLPNFADGTYRTEPQRVSWFARLFPGIFFYCRFAANVLRSSWRARRGQYNGQAWSDSSWEVLHSLEKVGIEFEITGLDQLEKLDSPCLIVGNHMSTLETNILPGLVQPFRNTTFVVKSSLLNYPVFGHIMRSRDPIAVSQTDARQDFKTMMSGGTERLARGTSLVVFPQGQRTPTFIPSEFNTIGIKLAKRAGVPIVPVALLTDAWGIGKWIPDVGKIDPTKKVRFAFGKPIHVQGRGTEEQQEIIDFIEQHLEQWNT